LRNHRLRRLKFLRRQNCLGIRLWVGGRVFERAELPGNPILGGGKVGKVLGF
jgi:hypothetical protein